MACKLRQFDIVEEILNAQDVTEMTHIILP